MRNRRKICSANIEPRIDCPSSRTPDYPLIHKLQPADLRITAFYCGLTVGCIKIKVKNVGKYPAYNVTCTAKINMINLLMDGRDRYEKYTTIIPEIDPGQEVEVEIGDIFLFDPLFIFWDCTLEIVRVEADNANHDIFLEGGKIKKITIIGPYILPEGWRSLNPNNWRWEPVDNSSP